MDINKLHTKFQSVIRRKFFVRIHMSGMLAIVIATGVLGSKALQFIGLKNVAIRYPLMVLLSYAVFFLLIRIWLRYVAKTLLSRGRSRSSGLLDYFDGNFGFGGGSSGASGTSGDFRFTGGGGKFGGGGASGIFAEGEAAPVPVPVSAAASPIQAAKVPSGKGLSLSGLSFDDDGLVLLILFVLLVLAILGAGFYVIYQAPAILSDAAFQACLGSGLFRTARNVHDPSWERSVLKATIIPCLIVFVMAAVLGYAAHRICPAASTLREVWRTFR
jgi:hypothetical protein